MKNPFIEIFSSGTKTAGVILFIALIFVLFFYSDNKNSMASFSTETKITPQEEIIELKKEIEYLKIKLEN